MIQLLGWKQGRKFEFGRLGWAEGLRFQGPGFAESALFRGKMRNVEWTKPETISPINHVATVKEYYPFFFPVRLGGLCLVACIGLLGPTEGPACGLSLWDRVFAMGLGFRVFGCFI